MDSYETHQFEVLLAGVAEQLAERIGRRSADPAATLAAMRSDPQGEGVWLDEFVAEVFSGHRLDDVAGASFVLQALHRRLVTTEETVSDVMIRLAKGVFTELLAAKTVELLAVRRAG